MSMVVTQLHPSWGAMSSKEEKRIEKMVADPLHLRLRWYFERLRKFLGKMTSARACFFPSMPFIVVGLGKGYWFFSISWISNRSLTHPQY